MSCGDPLHGADLGAPGVAAARHDRIAGALLGAAAGDALGLPLEGLSPRRAARLFPGPLRHRLLPGGRGLVSDDTDHACLVGQALLAAGDDPARLGPALAWRLRGWLLTLPPGLGWATLRSCVKLLLFVPARRQGVRSAGNGPCMRAPLLGVVAGGDEARLAAWIAASTRLTHTDPRALEAALCVALAARDGAAGRAPATPDAGAAWADALPERVGALAGAPASDDLRRALAPVVDAARRGDEAVAVARALGLERGVTGYALHTLPAVLACWLRRPADVRAVVSEVVALGGDADTTGAIAGGLAGATAGAAAIPAEWLEGVCEWPRSVAWMRALATRLAARFPAGATAVAGPGPAPVFWPALPARNLAQLVVVLLHGLRRALPPY